MSDNEPTHPWLGGVAPVRARHVPEPVARWILDRTTEHDLLIRTSGDMECVYCNRQYRDHPEVLSTFVLLCDGRVGKL